MTHDVWSRIRWQLAKPEYLLQPAQLLRRLKHRLARRTARQTVRLPWGISISLTREDQLSRAILRKGIHDLTMSEVVWRLLDDGELAVDVGTNIGYVTGLMAVRAGPSGRVLAVEPHPGLLAELEANVRGWSRTPGIARITVSGEALSERMGTGTLRIPRSWDSNRGIGTLTAVPEQDIEGYDECVVQLTTLDTLLAGDATAGVMKVDVEGHEAAVFRGAERLFRRRAIRDIVFEDLGTPPTPTMRLLEGAGYAVFSIRRAFRGPRLGAMSRADASRFDPANFLATLDAARAAQRLEPRGWRVLRRYVR